MPNLWVLPPSNRRNMPLQTKQAVHIRFSGFKFTLLSFHLCFFGKLVNQTDPKLPHSQTGKNASLSFLHMVIVKIKWYTYELSVMSKTFYVYTHLKNVPFPPNIKTFYSECPKGNMLWVPVHHWEEKIL